MHLLIVPSKHATSNRRRILVAFGRFWSQPNSDVGATSLLVAFGRDQFAFIATKMRRQSDVAFGRIYPRKYFFLWRPKSDVEATSLLVASKRKQKLYIDKNM